MTRFLLRPLWPLLIAGLLAACGTPAPPPAFGGLSPPPAEWLAAPAPLPDIPLCPQQSRQAWISCRAPYDETTRRLYVHEVNRRLALAGWSQVIISRRAKGA